MKRVMFGMCAAILTCCAIMGCKGGTEAVRPVQGVLEQPAGSTLAPQGVAEVLQAEVIDNRFECLLCDSSHDVSVWSLLRCDEETSAEGYGIVVKKGQKLTMLPNLRHGNMPAARYDAGKDELWLTGADLEGSGVRVERPYLLRFDAEGSARIAATIDPYEMQQAFCQHLGYDIHDEDITFYADNHPLVTVTNHVQNMGGFYEDAVWIGEQISYDLTEGLAVSIVPGISFVVGKVLTYDDMPVLKAAVTLTPEGFTLSDFTHTLQ